jgi:hypothetical protein
MSTAPRLNPSTVSMTKLPPRPQRQVLPPAVAAAAVEQLLAMERLQPAVAAVAAVEAAALVPQQRPVTELLAAVVPQVFFNPKRDYLTRIIIVVLEL